MKKVIVISANSSWYILNFRKNTIKLLLEKKYKVYTISGDIEYKTQIEALGALHIRSYLNKSTKSPLKDLWCFICFLANYLSIKPICVLNFTPKSNIYSTIAAKISGAKVIDNIAGLGSVFVNQSLMTKLIVILYKFSLTFADFIYFQNSDDMELFLKLGIVENTNIGRLPGSGVDLLRFSYSPIPLDNQYDFVLVARMLKEKGVEIYCEAAKRIRIEYSNTRFALLGSIDESNPNTVSRNTLAEWEKNGDVIYLGMTDSVADIVKKFSAVVLPSYYREGVPKSLLEAGALGRPIITTNNVGCRETVIDGVTGYLCEIKNVDSLVTKLRKYILLDYNQKVAMGFASHNYISANFDETIVLNEYMNRIKILLE